MAAPNDHSPPRHGACRRTGRAHAADHRHDAEAAGAGRRPGRCSTMCSTAWPRSNVERAVVNVHYLADQIERHLASRKKPQIVISDERAKLLDTGGGVVKALAELGRAPFFHVNSDTIWIDGVKPNLDAACRSVRSRQHGRAAAAGADRGPASAMPAAATSPWAPTARLQKRGEQEVAPYVYAGAALLAPKLFDGAPAGRVLADQAVRPGGGGGPAARPAARRRLDARRHARRDRAGRGGDPGEHGVGRLTVRALPSKRRVVLMPIACFQPHYSRFGPHRAGDDTNAAAMASQTARLHDPGVGAIPADADRRAARRQAGAELQDRRRSADARAGHALPADAARLPAGARRVPPAHRRGDPAAHRADRRRR